jgi:transaldolase
MMDTLLKKLFALSEIVPETADLAVAAALPARHVNSSAAKITAAAQDPAHTAIVDAAVQWAQKDVGKGGNRKLVSMRAVERLAVEFTRALCDRVQGRVSVELDGRLAYQRRPTIDKARELVAQLGELGISKERVLVKIPATWEGIEAAKLLREKSDIRCHLTLVFALHQAAACADAGAEVIAPSVGRISDWHKQKGNTATGADDPGVRAVWTMRDYMRTHGYETVVMPGTFRGLEQALALAGCEMISLPTPLIDDLRARHDDLEAAVDRHAPPSSAHERMSIDAGKFQSLHAADEMAQSKLNDGVRNLSFAVVSQQQQLGEWITKRQDEAAETSTLALFRIWDYDGDGYIDREEWNGTDEVFNALDRDKNGRITLEEMAIGLGAPHRPEDT